MRRDRSAAYGTADRRLICRVPSYLDVCRGMFVWDSYSTGLVVSEARIRCARSEEIPRPPPSFTGGCSLRKSKSIYTEKRPFSWAGQSPLTLS